jgi:hypothetical protein
MLVTHWLSGLPDKRKPKALSAVVLSSGNLAKKYHAVWAEEKPGENAQFVAIWGKTLCKQKVYIPRLCTDAGCCG